MGCRLSRCITPVTDDELSVVREYSLPKSIMQENQPHSLMENILPGSVPVPMKQSTELSRKFKPDRDSNTMASVSERKKWKGKEGTRKQAPKILPQYNSTSSRSVNGDISDDENMKSSNKCHSLSSSESSMQVDQAHERRPSYFNGHANCTVVSSTATSSRHIEKEETTTTNDKREARNGSIISEPQKKPLPESRIPKPKFTYQPQVIRGQAAASSSDCPQQGTLRKCAYDKSEEARNGSIISEIKNPLPESRIPKPKFTYQPQAIQGQAAASAPDCPQQGRLRKRDQEVDGSTSRAFIEQSLPESRIPKPIFSRGNNKWGQKRSTEVVKQSLPESHIPKPKSTYKPPVRAGQRAAFAPCYPHQAKPEKKQHKPKFTRVQPFSKPSTVATAIKTLTRPLTSRNRIHPRGAASDNRRTGMAHPLNQPSFPYSLHMLSLPKILSEISSFNYEMIREKCLNKKKEGLMIMKHYINLQIELRLRLLKEYKDAGIYHNPFLMKEILDLEIVKENVLNAVEDMDRFIRQTPSAAFTEEDVEDLLPF